MNRGIRVLPIAMLLLVAIAVPLSATEVTAPEEAASFMFVQNAKSGELVPIQGATDRFELVLRGVTPTTIYFSDRPERIVGDVPTEKFLAGLGFGDANPPNAALDLASGHSSDVIVVELRKPRYDAAAKELRYEVQVLKQANGALAEYSKRMVTKVPAKFERASLFIDDCSDGQVYCYSRANLNLVGLITVGFCWHFGDITCHACHKMTGYSDQCNAAYPDPCKGDCYADDTRH